MYTLHTQCFSLSACGARQMTEEWGELNIICHLEAFGAFYTQCWAAYDSTIRTTFAVLPINCFYSIMKHNKVNLKLNRII